MQVPLRESPDAYAVSRCIDIFSYGLKIIKNITEDGDIYYTVVQEPEVELIESVDGVSVKASFIVADNESPSYARTQAMDKVSAEMEFQELVHGDHPDDN